LHRADKYNIIVHSPTFTEVLPSSSEALLPPPCLLLMLIRLVLLGALIIALTGRCERPDGEAGGELAISLEFRSERQNVASLSDLLPKPMLTESGPALR